MVVASSIRGLAKCAVGLKVLELKHQFDDGRGTCFGLKDLEGGNLNSRKLMMMILESPSPKTYFM